MKQATLSTDEQTTLTTMAAPLEAARVKTTDALLLLLLLAQSRMEVH